MPRSMTRRYCDGAPRCDVRREVRRLGKPAFEANQIEVSVAGVACGIPVTRRAQPFGGWRAFWLCPGCKRACELLYVRKGCVECRRCSGMSYASQARGAMQRRVHSLMKVRVRLGQPKSTGLRHPFPERPYGMHEASYSKIKAAALKREAQHWSAIRPTEAMLRRLGGVVRR